MSTRDMIDISNILYINNNIVCTAIIDNYNVWNPQLLFNNIDTQQIIEQTPYVTFYQYKIVSKDFIDSELKKYTLHNKQIKKDIKKYNAVKKKEAEKIQKQYDLLNLKQKMEKVFYDWKDHIQYFDDYIDLEEYALSYKFQIKYTTFIPTKLTYKYISCDEIKKCAGSFNKFIDKKTDSIYCVKIENDIRSFEDIVNYTYVNTDMIIKLKELNFNNTNSNCGTYAIGFNVSETL